MTIHVEKPAKLIRPQWHSENIVQSTNVYTERAPLTVLFTCTGTNSPLHTDQYFAYILKVSKVIANRKEIGKAQVNVNNGVNTSLGSRPSLLFAHFNCMGEREREKPGQNNQVWVDAWRHGTALP